MDTRDLTPFAPFEQFPARHTTGRPPAVPSAARPAVARRWTPVVVGAQVRRTSWDDLTEEDLDAPEVGAWQGADVAHSPGAAGPWNQPVPAGSTGYEGDYIDLRGSGPHGDGYDAGYLSPAERWSPGDGGYDEEYLDLTGPEAEPGVAGGVARRASPPVVGTSWWDVPIWKPPRLWFVLAALVLTVVALPFSRGSSRDVAGATEADDSAGAPAGGAETTEGVGGFAQPWSAQVPGVLSFMGNPSRSFAGQGPLPQRPRVVDRRRPAGSGAGSSSQVLVAERSDGHRWAITAGADGRVGFTDAGSGEELLAPLELSRPVRSTPTLDPDGYPLLYLGGDDGVLRVVALDRGGAPEEVWSMRSSSVSPSQWGTDWNGSPMLRDDLLVVGGGNSNLHLIKLNRALDSDGRVVVDPHLVAAIPTWDDQLAESLGDRETGVDASVTLSGTTAWVVNGGGLLTGWDLSPLDRGGEPTQTFRFWAGDAVETSLTLDETGALYLATSARRDNARTDELGRVMKLDPTRGGDPLVWSAPADALGGSGVIGAPMVTAGLLVVVGEEGEMVAFERSSGSIAWARQVQAPARATPVMVDGAMVLGSCDGLVRAWDLGADGPIERWSVNVGGCVESPVTAWDGRIFVPQRDGGLVVVGDPADQ